MAVRDRASSACLSRQRFDRFFQLRVSPNCWSFAGLPLRRSESLLRVGDLELVVTDHFVCDDKRIGMFRRKPDSGRRHLAGGKR
jgi:hypothetical protein